MINFFRRTRKGTFIPGPVGKYLLYALGEIALVMIGILLALQVNNWNNDRIDAIEEQKILRNLHNDLQMELTNLENHIKGQKIWVEDGVYILKHYDQNNSFVVDQELMKRINDLFVRAGYIPITTTFQTLENTGKLDLIQNEELKNEVVTYYHSLINFSNNTQNNNADLVDGMLNPSLLELSFFQPYLFSDKSQEWWSITSKRNYEFKSTDQLLGHLQEKLSDINNAAKIINVVNFRIFLANIQLDYAHQNLKKTRALILSVKNELQI